MSFAFFPPLRRPRPLEKLQRVILKRRCKQGERDGRRVWGGSMVGKGRRREMGVQRKRTSSLLLLLLRPLFLLLLLSIHLLLPHSLNRIQIIRTLPWRLKNLVRTGFISALPFRFFRPGVESFLSIFHTRSKKGKYIHHQQTQRKEKSVVTYG